MTGHQDIPDSLRSPTASFSGEVAGTGVCRAGPVRPESECMDKDKGKPAPLSRVQCCHGLTAVSGRIHGY